MVNFMQKLACSFTPWIPKVNACAPDAITNLSYGILNFNGFKVSAPSVLFFLSGLPCRCEKTKKVVGPYGRKRQLGHTDDVLAYLAWPWMLLGS